MMARSPVPARLFITSLLARLRNANSECSSGPRRAGNKTNVFRPRPAAPSDDVRPGGEPFDRIAPKACRVTGSGPATSLGIPDFAGVGVDDDRLAGGFSQLANQGGDKRRLSAVDADGDG